MGIIRLVVGALLVGTNVWLAGAAFEPIARDGRAVEYVLVCASFRRLVTCVALGGSTPGRYLVAIAPLLLLFAADAMAVWSRRSIFVGVFARCTSDEARMTLRVAP